MADLLSTFDSPKVAKARLPLPFFVSSGDIFNDRLVTFYSAVMLALFVSADILFGRLLTFLLVKNSDIAVSQSGNLLSSGKPPYLGRMSPVPLPVYRDH
jgi:hypothetical protein